MPAAQWKPLRPPYIPAARVDRPAQGSPGVSALPPPAPWHPQNRCRKAGYRQRPWPVSISPPESRQERSPSPRRRGWFRTARIARRPRSSCATRCADCSDRLLKRVSSSRLLIMTEQIHPVSLFWGTKELATWQQHLAALPSVANFGAKMEKGGPRKECGNRRVRNDLREMHSTGVEPVTLG